MNLTSCLIILAAICGGANPDVRDAVYLDVYNRDQALVREIRHVDFERGTNLIDFHQIANGIYGHTVMIRPLESSKRLSTITISFHYDLVNFDKMLKRYIGRWFSFATEDMDYEGRLLRFDDTHLFLQPDTTDPMVQVVERGKLTEMYYPDIPGGLFTEPTIRWVVNAEKDLEEIPVELTYITSDISWMCDYRLELIDDENLEMSGWFSLDNQLPLDFNQAQIGLVAGSTHRSDDPEGGDVSSIPGRAGQDRSGERLFEYFRYQLDNPLDIIGSQTIQVPFFNPIKVKFEKRFVYPHLLEGENVRVQVHIENVESSGLGRPLPEGDVGVYRRIKDGSLTFLGEDFIAATPVGGRLELDVGAAFDLAARRTRIAQARPQRDRQEETWRVELTSSRSNIAVVNVEQRVFGYWQVTRAEAGGIDIEYTSESANKLIFPVPVPPGETTVLTYTITYGY